MKGPYPAGPSHVARSTFLTDIETVDYGLSSKVDILAAAPLMSAMGQKLTVRVASGMSAFLFSDILSLRRNVRLVPQADVD